MVSKVQSLHSTPTSAMWGRERAAGGAPSRSHSPIARHSPAVRVRSLLFLTCDFFLIFSLLFFFLYSLARKTAANCPHFFVVACSSLSVKFFAHFVNQSEDGNSFIKNEHTRVHLLFILRSSFLFKTYLLWFHKRIGSNLSWFVCNDTKQNWKVCKFHKCVGILQVNFKLINHYFSMWN